MGNKPAARGPGLGRAVRPNEPSTATADGIAVVAEPRLQRIPRGPVLGAGTLGRPDVDGWHRMDRQGACTYTTNGRAAILLGLKVLGVRAGDRVLLPTYHCPTMVDAVIRIGAEPVYYPITSAGQADLGFLRKLDLPRVKALLAVHFFGLPQDLGDVRVHCDERGMALIEDCAHGFFGSSPRGPLGSVGDMAIGSLTKFFPVVEGGILVMPAAGLERPELRASGFVNEIRVVWDALELGAAAGRLGPGGVLVKGLVWFKNRLKGHRPESADVQTQAADLSAVYDTIDLARVGRRPAAFVPWLVQHADAARITEARRANYAAFARLLGNEPRMRPLFPVLPDGAAPYVFPLDIDNPDPIYLALRKRSVPMYRWDLLWPGTPSLPADATERWSHHVLQLACHQDMSVADVVAVADAIKDESRRRAA